MLATNVRSNQELVNRLGRLFRMRMGKENLMGENEKKATASPADLIAFGQHLHRLHGTDRTFEMEDSAGTMRDASLDEVILAFQRFFDAKAEKFKVRISYVD